MVGRADTSLIGKLLDVLDIRPMRSDGDHLWHKCRAPIFPKKTIEGGWTGTSGEAWRRFTRYGWQYSQNPTSFEEWADDQW